MTGIVYDTRYLLHVPIDYHPESPHRLEAIYSMLEKEGFTQRLKEIHPRFATEEEISLVHSSAYIKKIENLIENCPTYLDADTYICQESYQTAKLAVGAVLECIGQIVSGNVTNAFAFIRPPGHHAEPERAMGFCIFNNAAIGARFAQKKYNLKKILIIDFDLHHGNGTQWAFYDDPSVLYFSTHQYPYYPGTGHFQEIGEGEGKSFTVNIPLSACCGDSEYFFIYENILKPIALQFKPDFIIVSAGFDAYFNDPLGGMEVTPKGFGTVAQIILDIARQTCNGKTLFVLEGGYNLDGLSQSCNWVLRAMSSSPSPIQLNTKSECPGWASIKEFFGKYWKFNH